MIMAALRINLPTVLVTGGPMMPAVYKGKQYGTNELKEMAGKLTRGEISREEYEYMEGLMSPTPGSCAMMGTANTMSIIAEAMGLTMPRAAPAPTRSAARRTGWPRRAGMAVVRLVEEDIRPRDIVTQEMLELAVRVGLSVGGSTNMTLHMPAIAHEAKCTCLWRRSAVCRRRHPIWPKSSPPAAIRCSIWIRPAAWAP